MLLLDNWIRQCSHGLCYRNYFQVNANSINSVPNSNSEIERTVLKEETDPLLITFQDMQGKNEVCICEHLSILHRDTHECMLSPACLYAAGSKDIFLFRVLIKFGVHGSVHHNINCIEITNKMRPCSRIYYSNVS